MFIIYKFRLYKEIYKKGRHLMKASPNTGLPARSQAEHQTGQGTHYIQFTSLLENLFTKSIATSLILYIKIIRGTFSNKPLNIWHKVTLVPFIDILF
jgi:hypothetical protein